MAQSEIFSFFKGGDKVKHKKVEAKKRKIEESSLEYKTAKKRKNDNDYDNSRRARGFQESWKTGNSWLEFERTRNIMFCSACRSNRDLADRTSAFVNEDGCSNLQKQSVDRHKKSGSHKVVWAKKLAVESAPGNYIVNLLNNVLFGY